MIHRPRRRASASRAFNSPRVAVHPVGFDGDTRKRARARGPAARSSQSRSRLQPALPRLMGTSTGCAPITPAAAAAFGQVGVGISTSSPAPAVIASAILDRLHARTGDEEFVGRELAAVEPRVIAREGLAQFGDAALPGVEGLPSGKR